MSKLRLTIEIAGTVSIFSFGLIMMLATIVQWYNLNHIMWFNWNRYGEAYIEYVWCLLTLPCALYTLKVMIERLAERWSKL